MPQFHEPQPHARHASAWVDLFAHSTLSSTHSLHGFHVREQKHERVLCWYDPAKSLVLIHIVPKGKVPYTTQGCYEVTYRDMNGSIEITHGFILDAAVGQPQMLTPVYHFSNEKQSLRFQCAARQRQLLQTFETRHVKTKDGTFISFGQQLKLWQKLSEPTVTLTFFAHMGGVDPKHHYEFDILWFRQDVKRSGSKVLVLTFFSRSDERSKSMDGNNKFLSMFHRRPADNHVLSEHRSRRTSSHSRTSSSSSNHKMLPDGDRVVTPHQVYLGWRSLHIEFANEDAHESLWIARPESEDTLHLLDPVAGSYTSIRRPSETLSAGPREDEAVIQASDWFAELHALRSRLFHGALDEGVPRVGIAVLDTGIDNTNPGIIESWGKKPQSAARYRNFLADSALADDVGTDPFTESRASQIVHQLRQRGRDTPQDDTGHGTHVAGIILQLCPEANLYIGRVLEKNVTIEVNETRVAARRLALAILYATCVWKVKIISLSIGFHKELLEQDDKTIVRNAIKFATNAGVLIFAAASNEGNRQSILFPAAEPDPFCINSSNGYGVASEFNPPHQEQHENFSILGEGVRSTWIQSVAKPDENGKVTPSLVVRRGTSVATPIAAAVAALIVHFGRQWEPPGHEKLETRRGIRCILRGMAKKNRAKFYDIVPWHGVFDLTAQDFRDPIRAAKEKIDKTLDESY